MSRIRAIKPGFFLNEELAKCGSRTMLLFAGLWTLADREGRLENRPERIKAQLFPYTARYGIGTGLIQLENSNFIKTYTVKAPLNNGYVTNCIQIVNWHKHQKPHHTEKESLLPPPPD